MWLKNRHGDSKKKKILLYIFTLISVNDEVDEVAAQENLEDKLKDVIDGLTEKRSV